MDTTLAKGLALLDWLARQPEPCRLADVARTFSLARSSAHRSLQTLVECGWAEQDEHSAYRASLRLVELGALIGTSGDLKARLHAPLAALWRATGETIHLTVLDGAEVVYLDKFDSPLPVAAYSRIGGRVPAYCVASGKALLAAARMDARALRASFGVLTAHTPHTVVDFEALAAELESSRTRGHAINREEWREGVCGLGAPVFDARGEPVAAVGISVPSIRFARQRRRELALSLVDCAWQCSRRLGYRPADSTTPAGVVTRRNTP
jgi:DNA-binding IclR family transcriptional regulator